MKTLLENPAIHEPEEVNAVFLESQVAPEDDALGGQGIHIHQLLAGPVAHQKHRARLGALKAAEPVALPLRGKQFFPRHYFLRVTHYAYWQATRS